MSGWIGVILKFMLPYLVSLAVNVGLPAAAQWLLKRLPFISKATMDAIIKIISDALNGIEVVKSDVQLTKGAKKAQIREIKRAARRACSGAACPIETKAND